MAPRAKRGASGGARNPAGRGVGCETEPLWNLDWEGLAVVFFLPAKNGVVSPRWKGYFLRPLMRPAHDRFAARLAPLAWRIWLAIGVGATLAGLGLSWLGRLDALGYALALLLALAAGGLVWRCELRDGRSWRRPRWRRFRRPMPAGFLVLSAVAFLGGALYSPINYDTLWYRLPRVLHWLGEGRWHWIHTHELRFNVIATGMEWLWAPLVAWSHSDRLIFLPNFVAFLLLPGTVFSLFTRLGVRPRVAWWWMWLLPAGWVLAMQAGSAANDAYAAVYALLMVDFALRARTSGRVTEWWWALLAMALLTNTKQSNMPLGLLWLVAALPGTGMALRRPLGTLTVTAVGLMVSVIPVVAQNLGHTGNWMGWSRAEQTWVPQYPWAAVGANAVLVSVHNLLPPFFPFSSRWNALATVFGARFDPYLRGFEFFGQIPKVFDEASAGLGPGLILLAAAAWFLRPKGENNGDRGAPAWLKWSMAALMLLFLAKMGCRQPARYLAAYYPFLLVLFVAGGVPARIVRQRWWQLVALATVASSVLLLAVSKQRPVLPSPGINGWLAAHAPVGGGFFARWQAKQEGNLALGDRFAPFQPWLKDTRVVGYAANTIGELKLWEPYGTRRVVHVLNTDAAATLRAQGIRWVVVNDMAAVIAGDRDGLDWAAHHEATVVAASPLSPAEAADRRARGEVLDLEALAFQKVKPGEKLPQDNLYLLELKPGR
jgi:hypothetical protein